MITHTIGLALETLASPPSIVAGRVVATRRQRDTLDRIRGRFPGAEPHNDRSLR